MKNEKNQILSYSEESDMPLLTTTESVQMAIDILKDPTKIAEAEFEADEHFLKWWNKDHDEEPTQSEVNNYVAELVQECRSATDEEVRAKAVEDGRGIRGV